MSQHGVIKRYSLLIKKVTECHFPNLEEIRDYLSQKGFDVSDRTIQRDVAQIDSEFGIKIEYDKKKRGYEVSAADKIQLEPFLRFLEIFQHAELLRESLSKSRETLKFLSFETSENLIGIEFFEPALEALRESKVLRMTYQGYWGAPVKTFEIQPYLLKEYLNRWYVVACFPSCEKLYLFGLDRIKMLKVTNSKFTPNLAINALSRFENIVGINKNNGKEEKVILSFAPGNGNYIKSLPLHRSQRIIEDNENELRVELTLVPNIELTQKILMHSHTVKVVKPKWLADEIKTAAKATVEQYS